MKQGISDFKSEMKKEIDKGKFYNIFKLIIFIIK